MERTFVDIFFLGLGFHIFIYGRVYPLDSDHLPPKNTTKTMNPALTHQTPPFLSPPRVLNWAYPTLTMGKAARCVLKTGTLQTSAEVAAPLPKVSYGVCQRAPRNKPISFMDLWTLRPGSCMEWPFCRCCLNATKTIKAM